MLLVQTITRSAEMTEKSATSIKSSMNFLVKMMLFSRKWSGCSNLHGPFKRNKEAVN